MALFVPVAAAMSPGAIPEDLRKRSGAIARGRGQALDTAQGKLMGAGPSRYPTSGTLFGQLLPIRVWCRPARSHYPARVPCAKQAGGLGRAGGHPPDPCRLSLTFDHRGKFTVREGRAVSQALVADSCSCRE